MGFPKNFKKHPTTGERYKQIGNSVAIPVIFEVAKSIKEQNLLINDPQRKITGDLRNLLYS